MIVLADTKGKLFAQITIERPEDFASAFPGALFPCLIWDHNGRFTDPDRVAVATRLLDAGCRYAVCGGQNCEAWHDTIDGVYLARQLDRGEQDQDLDFVMTTWHNNESPDDVAFFLVVNTDFEDHEFRRYLVLHVGSSSTVAELDAAVRDCAHGRYKL